MSDVNTTPTQALDISGDPNEIAKQIYGYLGAFLDNPEIGPILRQAAVEGWSQDRLNGALTATTWWKTTSDSARKWDAQVAQDPASAQQQIANQVDVLKGQLTQLGVNIDDVTLQKVASDSLRFSWSDQQMKEALDAELKRSPSVLRSKVGTDYKALAQQYGVQMSDPSIMEWAAHSIAQTGSDEQFRQYLVQAAKSRFQDKQLGGFLDAGGTVDQYFDPYKQIASQLLGVDPNSISLTDDKWTAAINSRQEDGSVGTMTYDQWNKYLKANPTFGYQNTADARQNAYALTSTLGQMFGKAA